MNRLGKLVEDALDAIEYDLGFDPAPAGFLSAIFEQGVAVAGMAVDCFHELLHATECFFTNLFGIPCFAGMGHLDAELVHLAQQLLRRAYAMLKTAIPNEADGLGERTCGIAQQDPVDRIMDVGFHAGGVSKDIVEAQGGFTIKQFLSPCLACYCLIDVVYEFSDRIGGKHFFKAFDGALGDRMPRINKACMSEALKEYAVGHPPGKSAKGKPGNAEQDAVTQSPLNGLGMPLKSFWRKRLFHGRNLL